MPTYKQVHFIHRAVDSLLSQSLTAWELVIVDDGTPNQTARGNGREKFAFDYHAHDLIAFFRQAISLRARGWA